MTTKEQMDRLAQLIGDMTSLYAELNENLPKIRFVKSEPPNMTHFLAKEKDLPKLKYGDGTVYQCRRKRKDGTERSFYHGKIFVNGRQISVYGTTKQEVYGKLAKLRDQLRPKVVPNLPKEIKYRTYNEWLDEWIVTFKGDQRDNYRREFLRYVEKIREHFGKRSMRKITPLDVQKFIACQPKSNTTVKVYDVLNGSLQKAEDFGYLAKNPCRAVKRPTYKKSKRRAFELYEQKEICDRLKEPYRSAFIFLCCTGLRVGEFLALTEQSFDERLHVIKIRSSANVNTGELGDVKTETSKRDVVYLPTLPNVVGKVSYKMMKKSFLPVFRELGIDDVSLTHSCRHTYASMLHALGVKDKVIQNQCGHSSVTTTMDVYTNVLLTGDSPLLPYYIALVKELEKRYL